MLLVLYAFFNHLSKFFTSGLKEMYKEYTKWKHQFFLWYISICYIQKGLTWMFTEQRSPFLIPIGEVEFFL